MPVIVRKVSSKADHEAFLRFPWQLYKADPNWVPPLVSSRRAQLDPNKNPAWQYLEGDYYLAERDGRIVGQIAAFVNHRHNDFADENIAWFGMFEVYDDEEAAQALLNTAYQWAQAQGYDALRGPQSFTTHEECGLLVDNFSPPVLLMPYNPPYYQRLVENAGFTKKMDVHSMIYNREFMREVGLLPRLEKLVKRSVERSGIHVRPIDPKRKQAEFQLFRDLYNEVWAENWGFVPMTDAELDDLIENLGQFFDPNMAFFVEIDGEAVAFSLALPDFNQALHLAYPNPQTPEIWTLLKVLWHWKLRPKIKGVRMPLMGVKREHRNKGIEMALTYALTMNLLHSRYDYVDSGWVLETNPLVGLVSKIGARVYKTHRFYEKPVR
jgi:GNAT superfamily N-acetyltransferase